MSKAILVTMLVLGSGFAAQAAGVACQNRFGNFIYATMSGNKLKVSFSHPRDRSGAFSFNGEYGGKSYFNDRMKVRVIADKSVFETGIGVITYMRPTANRSGTLPVRFYCK